MKTHRTSRSATLARPRAWVVSSLLVAGLTLAPTAAADAPPRHGSCGQGAQTFTVPLAQAGQMDDTVMPFATTGQAGETVGVLHATYCDPPR
jgi:hypothetical protein